MVTSFRRSRKGGVGVVFDPDEAQLLRQVFGQLLELIGPAEAAEDADDPLAAAVGIGTATRAPEDPALARLFPDGYADPEAAAEFRRYTEPGLRAAKRAALQTAIDTLPAAPGDPLKVTLSADQAEAWLRALNDSRLVLGERLGVTEDWEELVDRLLSADPQDPRLPALVVYDRLTYLQESLVQALMG